MKAPRPLHYALVFLLALLALLVALARRPEPRRSRGTDRTGPAAGSHDRQSAQRAPGAARAGDASSMFSGRPESGAAPRSTRLLLQATLTGAASPAAAGRLRALVGPAYISADDLAEQAAWIERGRTGAGAESLEELANVREWIAAPVAPHDGAGGEGEARLGPVAVPNAPVYQILAWDELSGRHFHTIRPKRDLLTAGRSAAAFPDAPATASVSLLDAGPLAPVLPTGLEIRLRNDDAGQTTYIVRLERVVADETTAAESASRRLPLLALMAPDIMDAYQEQTPLFLTAEPAAASPNRLAPLLPDPAVRLVLSTASGAAARPVEVALEEGSVRPVELDLRELFPPGSTAGLGVRGRVLLGQSAQPLAGAVVERIEGTPEAGHAVTDADGGFAIAAIPADRPTAFAVTTSPASGAIPVAPERSEFVIDPLRELALLADGRTTPTEIEVTWRVPAYQWIAVDLSALEAQPPAGTSGPPYPIYILQQRPGPGEQWRDRAADHFLKEAQTLTVSVTEPGEYRVLAALNPALILESEPASVSADHPRARAVLRIPDAIVGARRSLRVVSAESGKPLTGARIVLSGAHRGLPPVRSETPTGPDGTVTLPPANRPFEITVQKPGFRNAVREISPGGAGQVEVQLP